MAKRLFSIATAVIVLAALVLAILLAGIRLAGITPYAVTSGSMEPAFHVGSLVYVKDMGVDELKVGDAITFSIGDDQLATHRIVDINNNNGKYMFQTKGDANEIPDAHPVAEEDVVGEVLFTIPHLGFFAQQLETGMGRAIAICIGLVLVCIVALQEHLARCEE